MRLAVWSSLVPMAGVLPGHDFGVVASTSNPTVFHPGDPTSAQIPCVLVHTAAGSAGSTATAELPPQSGPVYSEYCVWKPLIVPVTAVNGGRSPRKTLVASVFSLVVNLEPCR